MNPLELAVGGALAVVLLLVAVFLGVRVRTVRRSLRERTDLSTDERIYLHGQVRRRTWCVVLLAALALLFVGSYFLEPTVRELAPEGEQMTEAQRSRINFFAFYWGSAVVMLFFLLGAAFFDAIATAKFGMGQRRRLEESHRQELEAEAARLRQRRAELN